MRPAYYSNSDGIVWIFFWSISNFDFNLLFKLGYQVEWALSKWCCIRVTNTNNLRRVRDKNLFFQYKTLSLLLILFITFKAIYSPERLSSNERPRYVTVVWYCLICICSPYLISRLPTWISLCFVSNSIHFVFSSPKWILCLLSTNQSQTSEKFLFRFLSISLTSLCW